MILSCNAHQRPLPYPTTSAAPPIPTHRPANAPAPPPFAFQSCQTKQNLLMQQICRHTITLGQSVVVTAHSPILRGAVAAIAELQRASFLKLIAELSGRLLGWQSVLLIEMLPLIHIGDHEQAAQLHEQQSSHHRSSERVAAVEVLLLVVVVLLLHCGALRVVGALRRERTGQLLCCIAVPIEGVEEDMAFEVCDIAHSKPLGRVEAEEAVDKVCELRGNAEGIELAFLVGAKAGVVACDHVESEHSQCPEVCSPADWLVVEFFGRDKGGGENEGGELPLGVQRGQVRSERVAVLSDDDVLAVDAAVDDVEAVQFLECEDDACEDEADVLLQVGAEVGVVLGVVGEGAEVDVPAEVEVQAEEGVVFVVGEVLDDEGRAVEGGHEVLDGDAALGQIGHYSLFPHLLHHARPELLILLHQRCCEVLAHIVSRNGVVRVHPAVHAGAPVHCVALQSDNCSREILQQCFLHFHMLLLLRPCPLILPHAPVMRGHDFAPAPCRLRLLLAANVPHYYNLQ